MQTINVGLIGYRFMGKAHSNAYDKVNKFFTDLKVRPVMKVLCGRNEAEVRVVAKRWGWECVETDWRKLVARDDVDLVDIAAPNALHAPMAIAAAEAGKHILCEKPMATSLTDARAMLDAVAQTKVRNMLCFNYRRVPAVALAKQLIEEGQIGTIRHFRATYLQEGLIDPDAPIRWKMQRNLAGSGVHGDLNSHLIDLSLFLVGKTREVCGLTETFVRERPDRDHPEKRVLVDVDDAALFLARFENGALGSFEATRYAPGRKNCNRFEINGSRGSLSFNFERMNELEFYSLDDPPASRGFRTILATEARHPYSAAWWPPGHVIGYEHTFGNVVYDFLTAIAEDREVRPDFRDGVYNNAVLDAVLTSAEERCWVSVPEV